MVKVEQIRLLETKVQNAIKYIDRLRAENSSLRKSLETYEERVSELESVVNDFKSGQEEIEKGIVSALKQLDQLEDELVDQPDDPAPDSKPSDAVKPARSTGKSAAQQERTPPQTERPAAGSPGVEKPAAKSSAPGSGIHSRETSAAAAPQAARPVHPEANTPFPGKAEAPDAPQPVADDAADEEVAETAPPDSELDIF